MFRLQPVVNPGALERVGIADGSLLRTAPAGALGDGRRLLSFCVILIYLVHNPQLGAVGCISIGEGTPVTERDYLNLNNCIEYC